MKKFLPVFIFIFVIGLFFFTPSDVFAQNAGQIDPTDNTWIRDSDVTFAGKLASRSGLLLNWMLENPQWSAVSSGDNPLAVYWGTVRNTVYWLLLPVLIVSAFIMIVTRGRSVTLPRFIIRFVLVVVFIFFSFSIVQFLYQLVDFLQVQFLRKDGIFISSQDLLNVAFNYKDFIGYRLQGPQNDESAFVSTLLVKLTAFTYFVMVGVLLIRKIILWFFIVLSPVFPILLFFYPVRNTAKIWIGEFFRWLMYGPLFALFLSGLVEFWRRGIPLSFSSQSVGNESEIIFPTAINIVLGGPGQTVGRLNSVNVTETFALYVVSLVMLWIVIILPFVLLRIFLNFFYNMNSDNNAIVKQIVSTTSSLFKPPQPPPAPGKSMGFARALPFSKPPIIPPQPTGAGLARQIPTVESIRREDTVRNIQSNTENISRANLRNVEQSQEILKLTNIQVPTIRDIAKYEASTYSSDIRKHEQVAQVHEQLERIGNPRLISSPLDREKFNTLRTALVQEGSKGNALASAVLTAANTVSPQTTNISQITQVLNQISNPQNITNVTEREKFTEIKNQLEQKSQAGDTTAQAILSASKSTTSETNVTSLKEQIREAKEKTKDQTLTNVLSEMDKPAESATPSAFPVANRVQAVNLDDYEAVRKMWQENYQKLEPPRIQGQQENRKDWIKREINSIQETINLLLSKNTEKTKAGMQNVSRILPFLLIGGFSQAEIIAYLKAKLEAGKVVLADIDKKDEEENTQVDRATTNEQKPKEMSMEAHEELPVPKELGDDEQIQK